ncbi:hypothetical protein NIES37_12960 [Tolypothrix tenuis PCC 7101]|uniref:Uncharacterized protein n=1 Tax=Tolypothrix tenuis PCC 7101 TaxID=231146 RepID=A0A1Z4MV59_9CYAN|nr:hypothetical protein [Aulosira sp. FACHB-113]BAY97358.1 hypothetical protein NIES37_12960 [Tolypothrix tenuis PCC 7101]BAZ72133.1 hypothetical protein NIES50_06860 [Aulosira laxa NIES-50]
MRRSILTLLKLYISAYADVTVNNITKLIFSYAVIYWRSQPVRVRQFQLKKYSIALFKTVICLLSNVNTNDE